jgi:hypothetical protein
VYSVSGDFYLCPASVQHHSIQFRPKCRDAYGFEGAAAAAPDTVPRSCSDTYTYTYTYTYTGTDFGSRSVTGPTPHRDANADSHTHSSPGTAAIDRATPGPSVGGGAG